MGNVQKGPVALIIMDGVGLNPSKQGNAVMAASTPNLLHLYKTYSHAKLAASGEDVGLMEGQMGDSNVGHLNIGAGRVVYQYVQRIQNEIRDGAFYENEALTAAVARAASSGQRLHLMGLVSNGGVHSHIDHLIGILRMAKQAGCSDVLVHVFTDGRDVPPTSGQQFVADLEATMQELGVGKVATVSGRYFAMDRDRRWERTKRAYDAMVLAEGESASSGASAVAAAYDRGETDEFIQPTVIRDAEGNPVGSVQDGDAVIFFNFRADRARQITRAFTENGFDGFELPANRPEVHFTTLTRYDETFNLPFGYAPLELRNTLGEVLSVNGLSQLRVAETEKYAHVTFFFNGGREQPFEGEDQELIPSPKVATYDLKPEMSAFEIAETVVQGIESSAYDVYIINFANGDMVGHTGDFDAAVKAVEAVDTCVGKVLEALLKHGGEALVTADHGNADQMIDYDTGGPHTFHTLYPVPVIYVSDQPKAKSLRDGRLADLAPTILELLDIAKPDEMDGQSLLQK